MEPSIEIMSFDSSRTTNVTNKRRECRKPTNYYLHLLSQLNLLHLVLLRVLVHAQERQMLIVHIPTLILILDPTLDQEVDRKMVNVEDNVNNDNNNNNNNNNNLGNNPNKINTFFLEK
jgi:hypothetical protein